MLNRSSYSLAMAVSAVNLLPLPVAAFDLNDLNKGLQIIDTINRLGSAQQQQQQPQQGQNQTSQQVSRQQQIDYWKQIQARLNQLGYNAGPVDGRPGNKTYSALRSFQATNGLLANGEISEQTNEVLFSSSAVFANVQQGEQSTTEKPKNALEQAMERRAQQEKQAQEWERAKLRLTELGYDPGGLGTQRPPNPPAVEFLQRVNGLRASGQLDPETSAVLFSQEALAANAPPRAPSSQPQLGSVSSGTAYYGYTTCGGQPVTFRFDYEEVGSGRYTAEVVELYRWSQAGNHRLETMVGESAGNSKVAFVHDGRQLHGIQWLGNNVVEFDLGASLNFSIPGSDCEPGILQPFDEVMQTQIPATGSSSTFFNATTPRDKCEALIGWLSRDDVFDPTTQWGNRNFAKLYVDDLFVPVFGVPYDQISEEDIKTEFWISPQSQNYTCHQEPFAKGRWIEVERMYSAGFIHVDHHKPYIDWYVRRARNIFPDTLATLQNTIEIYSINSLKDVANQADLDEFLTVAQRQELDQTLARLKTERALVDQERYMLELSALPAKPRILELQQATQRKPLFYKFLLDSERVAFDQQVAELQTASVDAELQPVLLNVQLSGEGIEGLVAANTELSSSIWSILDEGSRNFPVSLAIQQALEAKRAAIVSAERKIIDAFPPTQLGLQESLQWVEAFSSTTQPYLESDEAASLLKAWTDNRDMLLGGALPEFESKLANTDTEQINGLLEEYISSEHDATRTIALEYEFAAEMHR